MRSTSDSLTIRILDQLSLLRQMEQFLNLSDNVVEAGADLGWENPLDRRLAADYWDERSTSIDDTNTILFGGYVNDQLVGTVQLQRGYFQTSRHRAEIAKLMVHTSFRRRGYAMQLMKALETRARELQIELLVLDTRPGEPVELLYERMGYTCTGLIPNWMKYVSGTYRGTLFYYKLLAGHSVSNQPST